MIIVYLVIAVLIELLYINISHKTFEFWTSYFILKKGGVPVPINWLITYLTIALFLFTLFHILAIVFAFVVLE